MNIGYACIPLLIPYKTNRSYKLSTYTETIAIQVIESNLSDLLEILKYNYKNNINLFRISSDIIPLASHPEFMLDWKSYFKKILIEIGNYINDNKLRVSMHPGQYTIINSPNSDVVKKSFADLKFHADFLDSLGIDSTHKLILHVGGVYNDKNESINRFIANYNLLEKNIRNRLVIENDERCFDFNDVYNISKATNIPIVFDNLHEQCYQNKILSNNQLKDILLKSSSTWGDTTQKIHYSQQDLTKKRGAHSQTIRTNEFLEYLELIKESNLIIDIMFEVKDKNLSVLKINKVLNNRLCIDTIQTYKYFLISKGFDYYINLSSSFSSISLKSFYNKIDMLIESPVDSYGDKYVLEDILSKLESTLTSKELNYSLKLLKDKNLYSCKKYLLKLCNRYNSPMEFDYYFIY